MIISILVLVWYLFYVFRKNERQNQHRRYLNSHSKDRRISVKQFSRRANVSVGPRNLQFTTYITTINRTFPTIHLRITQTRLSWTLRKDEVFPYFFFYSPSPSFGLILHPLFAPFFLYFPVIKLRLNPR